MHTTSLLLSLSRSLKPVSASVICKTRQQARLLCICAFQTVKRSQCLWQQEAECLHERERSTVIHSAWSGDRQAISLSAGAECKWGGINKSVYSSHCQKQRGGGGETGEGHKGGGGETGGTNSLRWRNGETDSQIEDRREKKTSWASGE